MEWSFFDKIYCINLYTSEDRFEYIKKLSKKYNIPISFYRTYRSPKGGTEGCFTSHSEVIKDAAKNNYNNIIILEDDIKPNNLTQERLNNVIEFIKNNDFDIFYLGVINNMTRDPKSHIVDKNKKIYKTKSLGTHSYILNKKQIQKLKELSYSKEKMPIDWYYMKNLEKSYAIYPSLFFQGGFTSTIDNNYLRYDVDRKYPKLLEFYQNTIETNYYYLGWTLNKIIFVESHINK
jgi:GR25 family glycosyltransferase involved in LPS biosynthesis